MVNRRAFALLTLLCFAAGLLALPQSPTLICRLTGAPMPPIVQSAAKPAPRPCCTVVVAASGDVAHLTLTAPGCCDLRQGQGGVTLPTTRAALPDLPFATLLPVTAQTPRPPVTACTGSVLVRAQAAPRAPPRFGSPPRAPPLS